MAKFKTEGNKYSVTYKAFRSKVLKSVPPAMLLFLSEKVLIKEIISDLASEFIGEKFSPRENLKTFFSDETSIEEVINECSNLSFLSDKKIIIYRIVKKTGTRGIQKDAKAGFINYLKNPNPDNLLILLNAEKEFTFSNFSEFENTGIQIFVVSNDTQHELLEWCRDKLKGYDVDEEALNHLLQFVNPSYDEISTEIDKLKTFCMDSEKITIKDVNLCVGMTKDFTENNLFEAILNRDFEKAIEIYDNMSAKQTDSSKEVELRFVAFMNNLFINIHKLQDPILKNMTEGFDLYRALKLFNNGAKMYNLYKNYMSGVNELKIQKAFDYIYQTDKTLKFTEKDKKLVINNLIHNLINL